MSDASTIPIDQYRQTLAESVHFSNKTINSNIEKGGIRLAKSQALDLPYISARTLLADDITIPTDYQANAGKTATIFKAIKSAMLDEDLSEQDDDFKTVVNTIQPDIVSLFDTPYQAGLEHINIRMRQLLLPKGDDYLSISPISSAGVNHWLNDEVDDIKEARKTDNDLHSITTAVFGIGGANPQNVGSLVRAMQRPIYLTAPTANDTIRQAFSLYYKGLDYYIPNKLPKDKLVQPALLAWADLVNQGIATTEQDLNNQDWKNKGIEATSTNMDSREAEQQFLTHILRIVLAQGREAKNSLEQVADRLPNITKISDETYDENPGGMVSKERVALTPLQHPSVDLAIQGLIDPKLRDEGWMTAFAEHLAKSIVRQSYEVEGQSNPVTFVLEDSTIPFLARRIRGLLYDLQELAS